MLTSSMHGKLTKSQPNDENVPKSSAVISYIICEILVFRNPSKKMNCLRKQCVSCYQMCLSNDWVTASQGCDEGYIVNLKTHWWLKFNSHHLLHEELKIT